MWPVIIDVSGICYMLKGFCVCVCVCVCCPVISDVIC